MTDVYDDLPLCGSGLYSYLLTSPNCSPLWAKWRCAVDGFFPDWIAKNPFVDVSRGHYHRWAAPGHDPVDVLVQLLTSPLRGAKDAGHVFLTDFVTKQGIPIPLLSKSYLGGGLIHALQAMGVPSPERWLNLNLFDWVFGAAANIEAYDDLKKAVSGELGWGWSTAWDTFGEGALYGFFGGATESVPMLLAAAQELCAGAVALRKYFQPPVIPELTFAERFIKELPTTQQLAGALSAYLAFAAIKSILLWRSGKVPSPEIAKQSLVDVLISSAGFCISKALLATLAVSAGSMPIVVPVLIGAGTSFLLRSLIVAVCRRSDVENPFAAYPFYLAASPFGAADYPFRAAEFPWKLATYGDKPITEPFAE